MSLGSSISNIKTRQNLGVYQHYSEFGYNCQVLIKQSRTPSNIFLSNRSHYFDNLNSLTNGKSTFSPCVMSAALTNNVGTYSHLYALQNGPLGSEKVSFGSVLPIALFIKISTCSLPHHNFSPFGVTFNSFNNKILVLIYYNYLLNLFSFSTKDSLKLFELILPSAELVNIKYRKVLSLEAQFDV